MRDIQGDAIDQPTGRRAWRGRILHALNETETVYYDDGILVVDGSGRVEACDRAGRVDASELPACEQLGPHQLLMPGMIDLHVHLPQLDVTGCQAESLLVWLERYIFKAEAQFSDEAHARAVSRRFFQELLKNGTTTAAVFLTSHPDATRIAFEEALESGNRVIMGQNLMDVSAPETLIRPTEAILEETQALCRQWHGLDDGRLQYAWMPRFALTSSEALLKGIGQLRKERPDVYFHTHLSEQLSEIEAVNRQFPWAKNYTDVYDHFGLLGPHTILAHGIHLDNGELDRLGATACSLAHCPGSNFFLKSGRFRLFDILKRQLRFGLGSDVGAGPELSLFKEMKDAQYMQSETVVPLNTLFYLATLGGAKALHLEDRLGNFEPGKEADFLILDLAAKELQTAEGSSDALISKLVYLGDDRLVQQTYVRGRRVYYRQTEGLLTTV